MNQKLVPTGICALAALLATTIDRDSARPVAPAAALGPGGVCHAVVEFLAVLDRGEASECASAFVTARHGIDFDVDAKGRFSKRGDQAEQAPFSFWERGAGGSGLRVGSPEQLAAALESLADPKLGRPQSRVVSIHADCPSGDGSYAFVEFERVWGEGDSARRQPMRATVLVRHKAKAEAGPDFRVVHWHADRAD